MLLSKPQPVEIVFALSTLMCGTSSVTYPSVNSIRLPSVLAPRAPGVAVDKAGPSRGLRRQNPRARGLRGQREPSKSPAKPRTANMCGALKTLPLIRVY